MVIDIISNFSFSNNNQVHPNGLGQTSSVRLSEP